MRFSLIPAEGSRRIAIIHLALRSLQIVLAIIAVAIYGKQGATSVWTYVQGFDKKFVRKTHLRACPLATNKL